MGIPPGGGVAMLISGSSLSLWEVMVMVVNPVMVLSAANLPKWEKNEAWWTLVVCDNESKGK